MTTDLGSKWVVWIYFIRVFPIDFDFYQRLQSIKFVSSTRFIGVEDEILSIDEGTSYPVQYKMLSYGILGRATVDHFLNNHSQPSSWWLAKLDEIAKLC